MSEIKGTVENVGDIESFGNNGFTKRTLLVVTEDKYPQTVPVEFIKDGTSKIDGLKKGDKVIVHYNIRSNEYQGKYYISLTGWKIDKVGSAPDTAANQPPPQAAPTEVVEEECPF